MLRTHEAGTLRADHTSQTVTLTGWVGRRRDHGGVAFLDLRDASGVAQVVIRDESVAHGLRNEYCLRVTGEVSRLHVHELRFVLPRQRELGIAHRWRDLIPAATRRLRAGVRRGSGSRGRRSTRASCCWPSSITSVRWRK